MKYYSPTGRRNYGRPLKRLLVAWDRNGSTSGPTPWQIYDDDDDDDDDLAHNIHATIKYIFPIWFCIQPEDGFYSRNMSLVINYKQSCV
jgi:hypothetical protein